jgi:hypothetical protein
MFGLVAAGLLAVAPVGEGWKQVVDGDVKVFTRSTPGARVAETRAEMTMKVTPLEVREILTDDDFAAKGPYVAEYREIERLAPNHWIHYTRLALPIIEDRDFFIDITCEQDLARDGSGIYRESWKPWPGRPERKGVVRVNTNAGHWEVRPAADGAHAEVEYYLMFDPGGSIPGWVVDRGNKSVLPDLLRGIEQEAMRRRQTRQSAAR